MKLVYLLEGNMPTWTSEYIYGVQNKTLASSILMTSLRDDYHVIHSPTLASTAAVIAHVAAQLASGGLKPKPVSAAAGDAWQAASRYQGYPPTSGRPPRRHHWRIARDG